MRLALLTEIPAPFRIPLFNALAAAGRRAARPLPRRARPAADALRRCTSDEWRFDARVLRGRELRRGGRWIGAQPRRLARAARASGRTWSRVGGWNQPAFWQALAYARARRDPVPRLDREHARDARSEARAARAREARAGARRERAPSCPGARRPSTRAASASRDERIAVAPNAVDRGVLRARPSPSCAGTTRLHVPLRRPARPGERARRAARGVPRRARASS